MILQGKPQIQHLYIKRKKESKKGSFFSFYTQKKNPFQRVYFNHLYFFLNCGKFYSGSEYAKMGSDQVTYLNNSYTITDTLKNTFADSISLFPLVLYDIDQSKNIMLKCQLRQSYFGGNVFFCDLFRHKPHFEKTYRKIFLRKLLPIRKRFRRNIEMFSVFVPF